jgi:hypothetical protein
MSSLNQRVLCPISGSMWEAGANRHPVRGGSLRLRRGKRNRSSLGLNRVVATGVCRRRRSVGTEVGGSLASLRIGIRTTSGKDLKTSSLALMASSLISLSTLDSGATSVARSTGIGHKPSSTTTRPRPGRSTSKTFPPWHQRLLRLL